MNSTSSFYNPADLFDYYLQINCNFYIELSLFMQALVYTAFTQL